MKVRWTRESLRLRITPSELESLGQGNAVIENLSLPGGCVWRIVIQPCEAETRLTSLKNEARVLLSICDRDRLMVPETEGVYFRADSGIRYWIEKDFPCVHPRGAEALEPVTETFTAPDGFAMRKDDDG